MKRLAALVVVGMTSVSMNVMAADTYPRSPELVAAQAELDSLRAMGTRDQADAETNKRVDAALSKRNAELDKRNAEWGKLDHASMFEAQVEACSNLRHGLGEGKRGSNYFDELRYAGFSTDEALDIVLQINHHTPQVGKSVKVAFCILGLPDDRVRRNTGDSETVMFVYPKMFVHAKDGVITGWADR